MDIEFIDSIINTFQRDNPNVTNCHVAAAYITSCLGGSSNLYICDSFTEDKLLRLWSKDWIAITIDCGNLVHDFILYRDIHSNVHIIDSNCSRGLMTRPFNLEDLFDFAKTKSLHIWNGMFLCKEMWYNGEPLFSIEVRH